MFVEELSAKNFLICQNGQVSEAVRCIIHNTWTYNCSCTRTVLSPLASENCFRIILVLQNQKHSLGAWHMAVYWETHCTPHVYA